MRAPSPDQVVTITELDSGRFTGAYLEWNRQWQGCDSPPRPHDHLTREDALRCAEDRLRYRS